MLAKALFWQKLGFGQSVHLRRKVHVCTASGQVRQTSEETHCGKISLLSILYMTCTDVNAVTSKQLYRLLHYSADLPKSTTCPSSNYTHCFQLLIRHRMVAYSNHSSAENEMATRAMLIRHTHTHTHTHTHIHTHTHTSTRIYTCTCTHLDSLRNTHIGGHNSVNSTPTHTLTSAQLEDIHTIVANHSIPCSWEVQLLKCCVMLHALTGDSF